jgi:hypothetical protein
MGCVILYMCSKFEDLKYSFYKAYYQICKEARNKYSSNLSFMAVNLAESEALLFTVLGFSMSYPYAYKYYLRYSRAVGFGLNTEAFYFGLYLLHIASFYPKI